MKTVIKGFSFKPQSERIGVDIILLVVLSYHGKDVGEIYFSTSEMLFSNAYLVMKVEVQEVCAFESTATCCCLALSI